MANHIDQLTQFIATSNNETLAVLAAIKVFELFSKMPEASPEQVLSYLLEHYKDSASLLQEVPARHLETA